MIENQTVEFKETWRDEYLKWICGFANAQGGKIYLGINDSGKVIGLDNSKKLLEDIPNKIRDTMGIIAEVNLRFKADKEYLEIIISPSTFPISYKGEYHYRSGSTKQQLRGSALTEFLIQKTGVKWDAVPVDGVSAKDLDQESFNIFRREAVRSNRMSAKDLKISNEELLDKLGLIVAGKLKRAAVLLFYHNPERIITGCYVKIGKFGEGSDLQYQDELHGSLIQIADKVIDLIYLKYLKATITYEKDIRIETYPFPREAIREAIYNALIHNNYAESIPIQVRIEDHKLYISNSCVWPSNLSVESLFAKHRSLPYNPDVAMTFFRAGYVETWGRGIQKICEACQNSGIPDPDYNISGTGIMVKLTALEMSKAPKLKALDEALDNQLLALINENPRINQLELIKELKIPRTKLQINMKRLVMSGLIKRKGGKRFGYWEIVEQGK